MTTLGRSIAIVALATTLTLAATACGGTSDETTTSDPSATSGAPTTSAPPSTTPPIAPASSAAPTTPPTSGTTAPPTTATTSSPPTTVGARMPEVIGLGLQQAQDLIQTTGVFYSRSFDCTGDGRQQVLDRNWVVVTQTPEPGAPIGEGDALLGVVKLDEPRTCV